MKFPLKARILLLSLGYEWENSFFTKDNVKIRKKEQYEAELEGTFYSHKTLRQLLKVIKKPFSIKGKKLKISLGIDERGVFAVENILDGEVVEVCPLILLPLRDFSKIPWVDLRDKQLMRYQFAWSDNCDALALGFGSLYNHSKNPNAMYKRVYENETISFVATRNITKGEEILIDYQYDPLNPVSAELKEFFTRIKKQ